MMKHYILQGREVIETDLMTWAGFIEGPGKIIKQETTPNGYYVSTVFLGIDHNLFDTGRPLLFETMVWEKHKDGEEEVQERYSTYDEAEAGHKRFVEEYSNKIKDSN